MENDHYTFFTKDEFSGTYLFLLPNELLRLLDSYHFGPLEINVEYKLKKGRPYEYLTIDRFNSDNIIDTDIEIDISTVDLLKQYKINNKDGRYKHHDSIVFWKDNSISIKCGDCATMYLNGNYTVKIFWEKITRIADMVTMLRGQNLSVEEIFLALFNLVF